MYAKDAQYEKGDPSTDVLDPWIIARLQELVSVVTRNLDAYELDRATRPMFDFIDDLSTWYIRRSRDRFKSEGKDKQQAIATTAHILHEFAKVLAPFAPFMAETVYQSVGGEKDSIHLEEWPIVLDVNEDILSSMEKTRNIISEALEMRAKEGIKVRQPLQKLVVADLDLGDEYAELIKDEVNVKEVVDGDTTLLNTQITDELQKEGDARECIRAIQSLRKEMKLTPDQQVSLIVCTNDSGKDLVETFASQIKEVTNTKDISFESGDEKDGAVIETQTAQFVFSIKI